MKSNAFSILFCILLIGLFSEVQAQTAKLSQANKYFSELNYQQAIKLYEKVLAKEVVPEALFNLPECYRKIGDYRKAEYWYAQAAMHPEAKPEMHFYLGLCRLSNNNLLDAKTTFEKFIELAPGDMRGKQLLAACSDSARNIMLNTGSLFVLRNVEEVNTRFDEFSAMKHRKGIVYCAERDTAAAASRLTSAWTGRPFTDVYYIETRLVDEEKMAFKYSKAREFDPIVNTKLHDGPVCFSPDGTVMYFTRNFYNKGKYKRDKTGLVQTQIMSVKMTNTGWEKNAKTVEFANNEYSVAHPAITPQGDKMYFASDMPGGFGRMDIYVSYLEGGKWSAPINLGPEINTEGDEIFPWVDYDGTLYFASDGHTGLGGLDVYYTRATKGKWTALENMGAPINSNFDDFSYMVDSSKVFGYFSSNRDGGKGFTDIYSFTKLAVEAELLVFDKLTGKGFENVTITSECFPRNEFTTNADGKSYLSLPLNRECQFTLSSPEFGDTTINISTQGYNIGAKLFIQSPIQSTQLTLKVKGKITDENTGAPLSGAKVEILSNCATATQQTTSDSDGNYTLEIKSNCQYVVKSSKEGYFTTTSNFNSIGIKADTTFESNIRMPEFFNKELLDELDTSSVFQIENIYFGYDSDKIDMVRSTGLNQLLELMQGNADLAVIIRSHTDSRGDATYNQNLSERRAKAVADYLIAKGVESDRVTHNGYGESQPLNACYDGAACGEEEHKVNRRTEFKVKRRK